MTSRRDFLKTGALVALGGIGGMAEAVEPVQRKGGPIIKVGCCAYSYRKYLADKNPTMTLESFLETAAEIGCDGVEITSYYFPPDLTIEYLNKLKRRALLLGLDICSMSVANTFTLPAGDQRKAQIAGVCNWLDHAAELGAPCMRVFGGGLPKGTSADDAVKWVGECLNECTDSASQRGVMLALENHGGIPSTSEQVISIMSSVKSDWVGSNLDCGNFRSADPYAEIARVAPYAITTHLKSEVSPLGKPKEKADVKRIAGILKAAGYRGYLNLEYEGAEDPKTAVPKLIQSMKEGVV